MGKFYSFILCLWYAAAASSVIASDNQFTRPSLTDLPGVYVLVESLPNDIEQLGLTKEMVAEDVSRRLTSAGIRVFNKEEIIHIVGNPYLYVNIHILNMEKFVYSIGVELKQAVSLVRLPHEKLDATTWSKRYLGVSQHLVDIQKHIADMIDMFISAHVSTR